MKKFFYRVRAGEDLYTIAEKFNLPPSFLGAINDLSENAEEGDILYIEIPDKKVVRVGVEELITLRNRADIDEILKENRAPYLYFGQDIFL